jgi:hypothetical protein
MNKRKSDSATTVLDAPLSTNTIPLQVEFCDRLGPRPDGSNLWVDIEINLPERKALFHCAPKERVGTHKKRMVTYRADHACRLGFTKPDVFGMPGVDLAVNKQKQMPIHDTTNNVDATYTVDVTKPADMVVAARPTIVSADVMAGPHIFVP